MSIARGEGARIIRPQLRYDEAVSGDGQSEERSYV